MKDFNSNLLKGALLGAAIGLFILIYHFVERKTAVKWDTAAVFYAIIFGSIFIAFWSFVFAAIAFFIHAPPSDDL